MTSSEHTNLRPGDGLLDGAGFVGEPEAVEDEGAEAESGAAREGALAQGEGRALARRRHGVLQRRRRPPAVARSQ